MVSGFGERLAAEFAAGKHLCVGIDPHATLLDDWGLPDTAAGAERFGRSVVEAASGLAACVKPQVSFFERFGAAGFAALERVLRDARQAGVLVIADAKRGDIGSTFAAYAAAWLAPGAPLESDALTVSPYLGFAAASEALPYVRDAAKGIFVLAATSNPQARKVQLARVPGNLRTVAAEIVAQAQQWNADLAAAAAAAPAGAAAAAPAGVAAPVGAIGVVLGATINPADYGIDTSAHPAARVRLPVLAPGFGFQGAQLADAARIFGGIGHALLANESRSILVGGNSGLATRIGDRARIIRETLY